MRVSSAVSGLGPKHGQAVGVHTVLAQAESTLPGGCWAEPGGALSRGPCGLRASSTEPKSLPHIFTSE